MRKTLTAVVAAATLATAVIAMPTPADARRGWWGPALIGGLFAGALIGSAFARPYYGGYGGYYGGYGYPAYGGYYGYYRPAYYAPAYYAPVYRPVYYGGYYGPRAYYGYRGGPYRYRRW